MSREIKFRAWDCINEQMLPVNNIDFRNELVSLDEGDNSLTDTSEMFDLMQYTGLKDCNGKEIYEGDILRDDKGVGEVRWVAEQCAFLCYVKEPSAFWYIESDGQLKNTVVIGNIYENPELLEKQS